MTAPSTSLRRHALERSFSGENRGRRADIDRLSADDLIQCLIGGLADIGIAAGGRPFKGRPGLVYFMFPQKAFAETKFGVGLIRVHAQYLLVLFGGLRSVALGSE